MCWWAWRRQVTLDDARLAAVLVGLWLAAYASTQLLRSLGRLASREFDNFSLEWQAMDSEEGRRTLARHFDFDFAALPATPSEAPGSKPRPLLFGTPEDRDDTDRTWFTRAVFAIQDVLARLVARPLIFPGSLVIVQRLRGLDLLVGRSYTTGLFRWHALCASTFEARTSGLSKTPLPIFYSEIASVRFR